MDKVKLTTACTIITGKLDANAAESGGKYPYFTCAPEPLTINSYEYDGDVIILAGNNASGNFHCQRFNGKFNAYQRTYILMANEGYDIDYIYYCLLINLNRFKVIAQGSQTKFLTMGILNKFYIDNLSLEEQKKKAILLRAIDHKIILNEKINDNLYDLIKLIYDKTFYNHNKCDNTHWVQEFSINIPKDWKVVKLSTLIDNISTGLNPRNNFTLTDKGYKYVTVKNLTSKGSLNFQGCDYIDEEARKIVHSRSQVSKGDILFASISPLGRCYAVNENPTEWEINESVFSITPKNEILQLYLYMYLTSDYFIKKAEHSSTGSIFSGIRISTLENMPIILPTETTLDEFTNIVRPLFNKRDNIDKENAKLKELRNYLLPLLMNGQIVIAD